MQLFRYLSELAQIRKPVVLALGVFDGVHLGHQAVIHKAVTHARTMNGCAAILTFHPHPAKVLRPESVPPLLTTEQQDYELFSKLNVDICIILDFNEELSLCSAEVFLERLLCSTPMLRTIVVGPHWQFGHERAGNFQVLQSWAKKHSLDAIEVEPVYIEGELVSSTSIRNQIAAGDIAAANIRLGRPYQIVGCVRSGDGLGAQLGFPTANLELESELIPARGVYAARLQWEGKHFAAAVNIGQRPTVSTSNQTTVEAYILDFKENLYGYHVRLDLLSRLRDEIKFKNTDELKAQIARDIQQVRQIVSAFPR